MTKGEERKIASKAIAIFATMKNGTEYVGRGIHTLKKAQKDIMDGVYDPWFLSEEHWK